MLSMITDMAGNMTGSMTFEITAIVFGYLCGTIPFGLVLAYFAGHGDIRKIGSGNIGATNVLRTGNKKLAFLTLLLDGGKGAIAVLIAHIFGSYELALLAGTGAIIGHMFPVWLRGRGGKGVATTLGTLLALSPLVGFVTCLIWLGMAFAFRYSSLAALVALLLSPLTSYYLAGNPDLAATCSFIAVMVWLKHRANIKRLIKGEEPKIGQKKDKKNTNETASEK